MGRFMEDYSEKIHERLESIFQAREGDVLSTAEIKCLYKSRYNYPDVDWVQPSDHSINMTNKGAASVPKQKELFLSTLDEENTR
jgi:hypothetical protein